MNDRDERILELLGTVLDSACGQTVRLCKVLAEADGAEPAEIEERLRHQRELNRNWCNDVQAAMRRVLQQPAMLPDRLQPLRMQ